MLARRIWGQEGVHVDEQLTGDGSTSVQDPPVEVALNRDFTVCDVALVSCHTRAIDRDVVCSLLMKCLQDVSFISLVLHLLVVYYLVSNFRS
jgi:hypothetical protein